MPAVVAHNISFALVVWHAGDLSWHTSCLSWEYKCLYLEKINFDRTPTRRRNWYSCMLAHVSYLAFCETTPPQTQSSWSQRGNQCKATNRITYAKPAAQSHAATTAETATVLGTFVGTVFCIPFLIVLWLCELLQTGVWHFVSWLQPWKYAHYGSCRCCNPAPACPPTEQHILLSKQEHQHDDTMTDDDKRCGQ